MSGAEVGTTTRVVWRIFDTRLAKYVALRQSHDERVCREYVAAGRGRFQLHRAEITEHVTHVPVDLKP